VCFAGLIGELEQGLLGRASGLGLNLGLNLGLRLGAGLRRYGHEECDGEEREERA
jgi:hypothetical protein